MENLQEIKSRGRGINKMNKEETRKCVKMELALKVISVWASVVSEENNSEHWRECLKNIEEKALEALR